jgi:hypothetical protein
MSDRNADVRRVAIRRHIEDGCRRIALIRSLIAQVDSRGGDTTPGEGLLATMESALQTLVEIGRFNGGEVCAVDEPYVPVVAYRHGRDGQQMAEAGSSLQPVLAHAWNRRGRITLCRPFDSACDSDKVDGGKRPVQYDDHQRLIGLDARGATERSLSRMR